MESMPIESEETLREADGEPTVVYKNIVVLIDGDNVSVAAAIRAFRLIEEMGHVTIRRVYGNWAKTQLKDWQDFIMRNGFTAVQQFDAVKGKNSTDIALTVDAVDIVNNRPGVDLIAIISSDSDYIAVAAYIRERGCRVIGFGNSATNVYYRNFLDEFYDDARLPEKAVGVAEIAVAARKFKQEEHYTLMIDNDADYRTAKLHLIIHRIAFLMTEAGKADSEKMLFCTSFSKRLNGHVEGGKRFLLSHYYVGGSLWAFLQNYPELYDARDCGKMGKKFRCRYKNLTVQKAPNYTGNAMKDSENSNEILVSLDVEGTPIARATGAKLPLTHGNKATADAQKAADNEVSTGVPAAAEKEKGTSKERHDVIAAIEQSEANDAVGNAQQGEEQPTTNKEKPVTHKKQPITKAVEQADKKSAAGNDKRSGAAKTAKTVAKKTVAGRRAEQKAAASKDGNGMANGVDYRLNTFKPVEFSFDPAVILSYLYIASGKKMNVIAKDLSIAVGSVSRYISGKTDFSTRSKLLADYFGVSEDFLRGKERPLAYNGLRSKVRMMVAKHEAAKNKDGGD